LTRDLYIFGTAGEGYAVSDRQFDQVITIFREETNRADTRAMIGVISLSLVTILERIARAREAGFRRFQLSLPSWGALNNRELMNFFESVCDRFQDCSFLHYNVARSKRLVTPDEYARLAVAFPNLVATKNSTDSKDFIANLMVRAPQLLHFFTEKGYGYAAQLGECGFLISAATMNFHWAHEYFEAGQRRDTGTLLRLQDELKRLINDLLATAGDAAHMDGAYDKFYCKAHDPNFPLHLLSPYSSFGEEQFETFIKLVRKKYPRWIAADESSG
jgi:dihydrodipicolinate synthase/N-acetylneuraminate lyase